MAFKEIEKSGASVAATKMSKGESVTAYLIRIEEREGKFGQQTNLVMMDPTNNTPFIMYTGGTLAYDANEGRLRVGLLTRITATGKEQKKNDQGKMYTISTFKVEQDDDSVYGGTVTVPSHKDKSSVEKEVEKTLKRQQV